MKNADRLLNEKIIQQVKDHFEIDWTNPLNFIFGNERTAITATTPASWSGGS
jgi:hypothetical protein